MAIFLPQSGADRGGRWLFSRFEKEASLGRALLSEAQCVCIFDFTGTLWVQSGESGTVAPDASSAVAACKVKAPCAPWSADILVFGILVFRQCSLPGNEGVFWYASRTMDIILQLLRQLMAVLWREYWRTELMGPYLTLGSSILKPSKWGTWWWALPSTLS